MPQAKKICAITLVVAHLLKGQCHKVLVLLSPWLLSDHQISTAGDSQRCWFNTGCHFLSMQTKLGGKAAFHRLEMEIPCGETPTASVEELKFTVDLSDLQQLRCWELVGTKKCQASTLRLFCFLGACGPPPDTACFLRCPTGTTSLLSVIASQPPSSHQRLKTSGADTSTRSDAASFWAQSAGPQLRNEPAGSWGALRSLYLRLDHGSCCRLGAMCGTSFHRPCEGIWLLMPGHRGHRLT